ncbi:MAG: ROK family transcriptional regulator [Eubacteriales bacterium]|nr:ROK family transcriptional regulator [Eubacteriales bacterium]
MGLSNMEVKRMNRNNILRYILEKESVSKNTVASALDLSVPTVAQCLKELQELGLVEEEGAMKSIGGRKAMAFRAVKDAKAALGVDITRNHVNIVITDLAMRLIYSRRVNIRVCDEASFERLRQVICEAIEASRIPQDRILGMGVSLPAIIDGTGKKIFGMHEQMSISYEFYESVKDWFDFPVFMGNDADSAGRAESAVRKVRGNRVYFFVSPSVGGAVILDGKTFYGKNRRAGEFGHMILVPGGKKCYCGRVGCVNGYCSTENLSDLTGGDLDLFFRRLEEKDEACMEVWDRYLDYVALAVHNLLTSFDMEIIIGGYLGQYIGKYMDDLFRRVRKLDGYVTDPHFIEPAILKYEASAIGAAMVFTEQYIAGI